MQSLGRFLIIFALFSTSAYAGGHDFTLFGGIQFPGDITLSKATSSGTEILTDPENVGLIGLRYGNSGIFGHEETVAYTADFLDSHSKSVIVSSNLMIQAPLPALKPYVTAGIGPIISWGSGVSDIGTKFALNYGGGVKIKPALPIGVRFDARGYSVFGVQSQTLKMGEVSAGIFFSF